MVCHMVLVCTSNSVTLDNDTVTWYFLTGAVSLQWSSFDSLEVMQIEVWKLSVIAVTWVSQARTSLAACVIL